MWIYIEHSIKKTSNALATFVKTKQDCLFALKLSEPHAGVT